jgi:hypothetical protein
MIYTGKAVAVPTLVNLGEFVDIPRVFGKFLAAAFKAALKPYKLDCIFRTNRYLPAQLPMPVRHIKKANRNEDASRSSLT